jgi:hypothetical protein
MNGINSQNKQAFFKDDQLSIDVTLDRPAVLPEQQEEDLKSFYWQYALEFYISEKKKELKKI